MFAKKAFIVSATVGVLASTGVPSTFAQGSAVSETPVIPGGLFGPGRSESIQRQRLDLMFSLAAGFDNELPEQLRTRRGQNLLYVGGLSTMFVGAASYARRQGRVQMTANALSSFRYYQPLAEVAAVGHNAALGAQVQLGASNSLRFQQGATYSPSYLSPLFAAPPPLAATDIPTSLPDYRIDETESYLLGTNLTFTHMTSGRLQVRGLGEYQHSDARGGRVTETLVSYGGGGGISRPLSRSVQLSVDYVRRFAEFDSGSQSTEDRITAGLQYSRSFWGSRRAVFYFGLSPTRLDSSTFDDSAEVRTELYRLQTTAAVEYPFRWNWRVRFNYARGVEHIAVLGEPVWSTNATLGVSTLLARRLSISGAMGYSNDNSALRRDQFLLRTYNGGVQVRFALVRTLAIESSYMYYFYDGRGGPLADPELAPRLGHHSVTTGLTVWVPTFAR